MNTKNQIVDTADRLFYQQGFEHTSFADIAKLVNISRGNFYHHFKTKDDILRAVIKLRLARANQLLEAWQSSSHDPKQRIKCYFSFFTTNRGKIKKYGCPMGSLSAEMLKIKHPLTRQTIKVYVLFRDWLAEQFQALGYTSEAAESLAMHVISLSQGIATLFNAFKDESFLETELQRVSQWLDTLGDEKKI